ncbi:hypothetical protein BCR32DRAFT_205435 [Anaeromyces robustus]|uniref:NodB homology domain-containing protein n=1 Tax=Anaeromyces robustus TaxID=1754192 RepID=A0A1Y1X1P7_9FUNG|nr:hypothetical protein BCR32DRAFT_205435 [Anaeromyces robustus]|eukprot:ORX79585.1 hypothetical protein BCR32DRAFT_205435 [Anaeromyces robustus]
MNILINLLVFAFFCIASVHSYTIGIKVLLLHTSNDETFQNTVYGLESYGIPYDAFLINNTENVLNGNLSLYDEEGNPKYYLVILTSGQLSSITPDGDYASSLSDEQWTYLDVYEQTYHIRRITFSDTPGIVTGTSIYDVSTWGNSYIQKIVGADNEIANEIYKNAGIKKDAPIATNNNFYHTPVLITNSEISTPVFYFEACTEIPERTVGAAYAKLEDGRERLNFYLPTASWSLDSIVLNHLWIHWGTRTIYNGIRRVTFVPHIDDVFISTSLVSTLDRYDSGNGITLNNDQFRFSQSDIEDYLKFKKNIIKKMPAGSKFDIDLAFNGNGVLPVEDQLQVDGNRYVEIDYVKPMGKGMKNWPVEYYNPNWTDEKLSEDDLYKYFKVKENRANFFWCSHTFTHENLDNASRTDVDNEIRLNIEIAKMLNLVDEEWWSGNSIVTPQISGLHNGDALEIFEKYNITSATGDISRSDITNKANIYHPFLTTLESSNHANFPVIPRSPTEIYYFASTPEEDTYIYNYMYHNYFGGESTWEQILERESNRVLRLIMLLRHEAHQFHQANLRSDDYNNHKSLLEHWVEAVVDLYNKYADWPLVAMKLDDLNKLSINRLKISQCNPKYKINIDNGLATEIIITTSNTQEECLLPITVPNDVVRQSDYSYEKLGNDPLTVWVKVSANSSKTIKLDPPINWYAPNGPTSSFRTINTTTFQSGTTTFTQEPTTSTTTQYSTTTSISTSPTSSIYYQWYADFFNTDWYSCGNQDYLCKQLQSDNCYLAVNSCWSKVPWPESEKICNEMNTKCSIIWTYVK